MNLFVLLSADRQYAEHSVDFMCSLVLVINMICQKLFYLQLCDVCDISVNSHKIVLFELFSFVCVRSQILLFSSEKKINTLHQRGFLDNGSVVSKLNGAKNSMFELWSTHEIAS